MNERSLLKMEKINLPIDHKRKGAAPKNILTLFQGIITVIFLSLVAINSLGFGLGLASMKIYQEEGSKNCVDREVCVYSKCLSPDNSLIKYLIPGFSLGCFIAASIKSE